MHSDNNDFLSDMDLPLANSNENLSIISENYLKPLFDVEKFVVRSEQERDKGIDFQMEIKKNGKFTNFRFAIQLKATDSKKINKDGSISLQVNTSNINYLLNNPMPAFYILYVKELNKFYFEDINDFAKHIYSKNQNLNSQSSHILRFSKVLEESGLDAMYQATLRKGIFQRKVNEKTAIQSSLFEIDNRITIDKYFNVLCDTEVSKMIEDAGFLFINEGKWKDVINIHKKASGSITKSSLYNLILGIANYYNGDLITALSFFKSAARIKSELNDNLQNHLLYFETVTRYSIGLINEDSYNKIIKQIEEFSNVGLYVKIENIKQKYLESLSFNVSNDFLTFTKEIQEIIDNPDASEDVKLNARCELYLFEGYKNNMEYVQKTVQLNAFEEVFGFNAEIRTETANYLSKNLDKWIQNIESIKSESSKYKKHFIYFNIIINEVKVMYELNAFSNIVHVPDKDMNSAENSDYNENIFKILSNKVSNAYDYFIQVGHLGNAITALATKYEITQFWGNSADAYEIINKLSELIENYDIAEYRTKFDRLKNGGTTHEKFKIWVENIFTKSRNKQDEIEKQREELERMDEEEKSIQRPSGDNYLFINLFPIGHFQFPKSKKSFVYEVLNINSEAIALFESMFEIVIPVANIYCNVITQEGYANGKLEDKGMESWKNIYRIRKLFYENGFYRVTSF